MGAAVIGGLFASTALSLFVVPVIYTLVDDFEHLVKRLFGRLRGRLPGKPALRRILCRGQVDAVRLIPELLVRIPACCRGPPLRRS